MLHTGRVIGSQSVHDFWRLPVELSVYRPLRLFDHDIDSTRQLAQTLTWNLAPALRVEQQHYTPGAFAVVVIAVTIFSAANIFGQLSYKGFIARCSVSRCSQRICLCVIDICSILNSTLQDSAELRASINYRSQFTSGGVCACFAFVRSRHKV